MSVGDRAQGEVLQTFLLLLEVSGLHRVSLGCVCEILTWSGTGFAWSKSGPLGTLSRMMMMLNSYTNAGVAYVELL